LSKRLHIPYAIGLMLAGAALAAISVDLGISLSPDLILLVLLPALIFEAAITLDWRKVKDTFPSIILIAFLAVIVTMAVVAAGLVWVLNFPFPSAFLFGALIAATDPVAVLAIIREKDVPDRFRATIQGESLINDGLAATLFLLILGWSQGESIGAASASWTLAKSIGGGVVCGIAGALLASFLAGRTQDDLVEITITILAAYGSYLVAHIFGMSGILAALTAGILLCNVQPLSGITDQGLSSVTGFWRFASFAANSIIFLLIGASEAKLIDLSLMGVTIAAFALMMVGRAVAVYLSGIILSTMGRSVPMSSQHLLVWGGLRGALPLALVLSIPADQALRGELVTITFGVVAISLVVQSLGLPLLLRLLRINRPFAGT